MLASCQSYRNLLKMIRRTLELDARKNPHEIRAAAAFVILLCRENLWPARDGIEELDRIANLATQQLTKIKQLFEQRCRMERELLANPAYRSMLDSLDQEIRILESRISDPKPMMPQEPPTSWGDFWY
jgi:hypothetical protein